MPGVFPSMPPRSSIKRLARTLRLATILLLLAPTGLAGAAAGDAADDVHVPAGETLVPDAGVLRARGDVVIDGDLAATPGLDLRVEAGGDVIVRGRIRGSPGGTGEAGGGIVLHAQQVVIHPEGRVEAGPGGHGAPAIVPNGTAVAGRGGDGGSVLILAALADVRGVIAPGRGGDGGHAYGASATGGDGGNSGRALLNGEPLAVQALAEQPEPAASLPSLLPAGARSHCTLLPVGDSKLPGGGNGGDACAHGATGKHGIRGADGTDDVCTKCGTKNHPPCAAFTTVGSDNQNGEIGQHGGSYGVVSSEHPAPPTAGDDAEAVGGRGGDSLAAGVNAGRGGNAVATGGTGGNGGDGGRGGAAGAKGQGCRGGNAGEGAPAGASRATGGAQGINPFDCRRDGAPGVPTAVVADGGEPGYRGDGGGGLTNSRHGDPGAPANAGRDGTATPVTIPPRVCAAPGAPTIVVRGNAPLAESCGHRVIITPPSATGGLDVVAYHVYLNFSATRLATIPPSLGAVTVYTHAPLPTGVTYVYEVSAQTAAGEGPRSAGVMRTTSCTGPDIVHSLGGGFLVGVGTGTAPVLVAVTAPGQPGRVRLTITHPQVTGPIQFYEVWRGTTPTSLAPVVPTGQPPAGSSSFDHDDVGLPLTLYYYQVKAVVGGVAGPPSNLATAVSALFRVEGTGTHGVVTEDERVSATSAPVRRHTCVGVATELVFRRDGPSFAMHLRTGSAAGTPAMPGDAWCPSGTAKGTQQYGNEADEVRAGPCTVLSTPAHLESGNGWWNATHDVVCDGRVVESHAVNVTQAGSKVRVVQEIVTFRPTGGSVHWRLATNLTSPEVGSVSVPGPESCPPMVRDSRRVDCATMRP